jgi:hypothetical protein
MPDQKKVELVWWDRDRHDDQCDCGLCDSITHISIGVAIFEAYLVPLGDPIDVIYAPSEFAAFHNARLLCDKNDWKIVSISN